MKKILSIVLSLVLVLSSVAIAASAAQYNDIPCVIVPGIGQSRAWLVDDNGEYVLNDSGEKIHCFPGNFDVKKILSDVAGPLATSVATQSDAGLSDALADSIENAFYMNKTDDNGVPCGYVNVETYPHSLAECTEEQRQYIFDCIPMQRMGETIGFENMYYYAYNSFGNAIDMINGLYDFIQLVKEQTGKDKVNIIPISMGGAIFNGLMELHPEVANDLHRIVFVVPALNGSLIVSDIYQKELAFLDADYLYSDFFDGILGETNASLIEVAIRVLPKDVLMACLNKTVDRLIENVFANCTGIWMLVPNDQYSKCVKMTLSDKSKAEIRRQTNIYHKAQTNSNKNILKFMSQGVEVFDVLGYDVALYNVGNSWNTQNADGVIHTYSTSIGAKMANVGETLGDGYVQKNTYCKKKASGVFGIFQAKAASDVVQCSDPTHNHISPDNVVDASTGLLPDYTFYFDNQAHATANQNDIIMRLCCELVETDRIKDVYTDANFPQFNVGRATKELREKLLPAAESVDRSSLSDADRQELEQAVADARAMLSRTIAVEGEAPAVEQRLRSILEKVGAVESNQNALDSVSPVVKTISDTLLSLGGAKGYSDMPKDLISNLTNSNTDDNNGGETPQDSSNPANTNNGNTANNVTPAVTPMSTNATNPKTNGYTAQSLCVCVAAFAAFSFVATVKFRKKKEE